MAVKKINHIEIYFGPRNQRKKVSAVGINKSSLQMLIGDRVTLKYAVKPSDAFYDEVEWLSSNEAVATVDEDGNVVAVGNGKTVISVTINHFTAKCNVSVQSFINFEDKIVERIMVQNYDIDGDGKISYAEAAKVTSILFPMFTGTPIRTFNELQYFTNVKTIAPHAFDSCDKLTSVTLPNSVNKIGKNAFSYCDSLTTVVIPPSVNTIEKNAFSNCDKLSVAYVNCAQPPKNGDKIFDNCPSLDSIVVPGARTDMYLDATNWGVDGNGNELYYSYIVQECFDYTFNFFLS